MSEIDDFQRDTSFLEKNEDFLDKHVILKLIHRGGDKIITITGEGVKSIVRECYHLSYQIVNSWCAILIDFISTSNYNDSRRTRIIQSDGQLRNELTPKSAIDLKSVTQILENEEDEEDEEDEDEDEDEDKEDKEPFLSSSAIFRSDNTTKNIPSKLENNQSDDNMNRSSKRKFLLFYPLFYLYPFLVLSLRFYIYLWSHILPDYAIHTRSSISSISTSRLPSDIDVNSEAISGLLEDLQIALFRLIHHTIQTIRRIWLTLFDPRIVMTFGIWLVTILSWLSGCFREGIHRIFRRQTAPPLLSRSIYPDRYQKWSDVRVKAEELMQNYFGTLEACRPPTIFDATKQPTEKENVKPYTSLERSILTKSMLGYPLEEYTVHTVDHYCIVLFRIPRPESKNVVYLQHGVMDTALAWVSDKPSLSLALQAYSQGYDVFFGSFRGTDGHYQSGRKRNEIYEVDDINYWDFNVDDLILDYRAFIQSIYVIKERERRTGHNVIRSANREYSVDYKGEIQYSEYRGLDESCLHSNYTLKCISHSMGGAVTLSYIAESIITHTAHHISNVVLLSPAGYLSDQSLIVRIAMIITPFFLKETHRPTAFPTRSSKVHLLVAKFLQDMQSTPATLELVNQICAMVIGGNPSDWPFQKVNYTKYPLGVTSLYVMMQFKQWYQSDHFTSYDYGKQGNLLRYGKEKPIKYTDYYCQFDVPIHFVAGKHDSIVPSTQVFRHYTKLIPTLGKKTSYVEFENAGHLQFTIGLDHDVICYVLSKLEDGDTKGYHGMKTEKQEHLCQFGFTKIDSDNRAYDL